MEKKEKIIIIGLVIVIIALAIGVASVIMWGIDSNNSKIPQGMEKYDFDSEFTMAVPDDARFIKEWNRTDEFILAEGKSYFDSANKFSVVYVDSPMVTNEFVNTIMGIANNSGNVTFEVKNDYIVLHNLESNGHVGKSLEDSNFTDIILIQKGHEIVVLSGNDLNLLKSMAETVKFYE